MARRQATPYPIYHSLLSNEEARAITAGARARHHVLELGPATLTSLASIEQQPVSRFLLSSLRAGESDAYLLHQPAGAAATPGEEPLPLGLEVSLKFKSQPSKGDARYEPDARRVMCFGPGKVALDVKGSQGQVVEATYNWNSAWLVAEVHPAASTVGISCSASGKARLTLGGPHGLDGARRLVQLQGFSAAAACLNGVHKTSKASERTDQPQWVEMEVKGLVAATAAAAVAAGQALWSLPDQAPQDTGVPGTRPLLVAAWVPDSSQPWLDHLRLDKVVLRSSDGSERELSIGEVATTLQQMGNPAPAQHPAAAAAGAASVTDMGVADMGAQAAATAAAAAGDPDWEPMAREMDRMRLAELEEGQQVVAAELDVRWGQSLKLHTCHDRRLDQVESTVGSHSATLQQLGTTQQRQGVTLHHHSAKFQACWAAFRQAGMNVDVPTPTQPPPPPPPPSPPQHHHHHYQQQQQQQQQGEGQYMAGDAQMAGRGVKRLKEAAASSPQAAAAGPSTGIGGALHGSQEPGMQLGHALPAQQPAAPPSSSPAGQLPAAQPAAASAALPQQRGQSHGFDGSQGMGIDAAVVQGLRGLGGPHPEPEVAQEEMEGVENFGEGLEFLDVEVGSLDVPLDDEDFTAFLCTIWDPDAALEAETADAAAGAAPGAVIDAFTGGATAGIAYSAAQPAGLDATWEFGAGAAVPPGEAAAQGWAGSATPLSPQQPAVMAAMPAVPTTGPAALTLAPVAASVTLPLSSAAPAASIPPAAAAVASFSAPPLQPQPSLPQQLASAGLAASQATPAVPSRTATGPSSQSHAARLTKEILRDIFLHMPPTSSAARLGPRQGQPLLAQHSVRPVQATAMQPAQPTSVLSAGASTVPTIQQQRAQHPQQQQQQQQQQQWQQPQQRLQTGAAPAQLQHRAPALHQAPSGSNSAGAAAFFLPQLLGVPGMAARAPTSQQPMQVQPGGALSVHPAISPRPVAGPLLAPLQAAAAPTSQALAPAAAGTPWAAPRPVSAAAYTAPLAGAAPAAPYMAAPAAVSPGLAAGGMVPLVHPSPSGSLPAAASSAAALALNAATPPVGSVAALFAGSTVRPTPAATNVQQHSAGQVAGMQSALERVLLGQALSPVEPRSTQKLLEEVCPHLQVHTLVQKLEMLRLVGAALARLHGEQRVLRELAPGSSPIRPSFLWRKVQ